MESKSLVSSVPNGNDKIIPVRVNGDVFSTGFEDLGMQPWEPMDRFIGFDEQMQKMQRDMELMQRQFNSPLPPMPQMAPFKMPPLPQLPLQPGLPVAPPMLPLQAAPPLQNGSIVPANDNQFPGPVVKQSTTGGHYMELQVDVNGFSVDDINVFTKDTELLIHAKAQREKRDRRSDETMMQEFKRQFTMPPETRPEYLRCRVSKEGILTVDAPIGKDFVPEKKARRVKFALGSTESPK